MYSHGIDAVKAQAAAWSSADTAGTQTVAGWRSGIEAVGR